MAFCFYNLVKGPTKYYWLSICTVKCFDYVATSISISRAVGFTLYQSDIGEFKKLSTSSSPNLNRDVFVECIFRSWITPSSSYDNVNIETKPMNRVRTVTHSVTTLESHLRWFTYTQAVVRKLHISRYCNSTMKAVLLLLWSFGDTICFTNVFSLLLFTGRLWFSRHLLQTNFRLLVRDLCEVSKIYLSVFMK